MMDLIQAMVILAAAAICSAVLTGLEIPVLKKKQFGQFIREEGPESHLAKAGTPTMGGVAIYAAILLTAVLCSFFVKVDAVSMLIMTVTGLAFGLIGSVDDYIKVAKEHNLGLTAVQKLVLQIVFAIVFAYLASRFGGDPAGSTTIWIPILDKEIDFGIFYMPFIAFVMVAMANSVNLTDGLDGLCSGVTAIISLFFAAMALTLFHSVTSAAYLLIMAGACLGFLVWNKNPAKIFMGDTGSMALGAGLTAGVVMMKAELLIPVAGLIYVLEALSVIIQVLYFKKTGGKRFFRMAPLHHHFELGGMKEKQVVLMFCAAAAVCCLVAWGITLL